MMCTELRTGSMSKAMANSARKDFESHKGVKGHGHHTLPAVASI